MSVNAAKGLQVVAHLQRCAAATAKEETTRKYLIKALKELHGLHGSLFQTEESQSRLAELLLGSKGLPEVACTLLPAALKAKSTWPQVRSVW